MNNIATELKERGLAELESAPLEKILSEKRTVYHGVDPTADSLHSGHLVPLFNMRRLAQAGHKTVFLVGGGTAMIGDPRDVGGERKLQDKAAIDANKRAIKAQLKQVMGANITLVDNADWLLKLNLFEFLRDIGKLFTVNDLVKRDIIKRRLETPDESISYTEFTYSLLQGYDFMMLHDKYKCDLQIGGTDQWTNMLSGVDLIRKTKGKESFVFTNPLMTDSNGQKYSKSLGNVIWLDAKKTSPFAFYQTFINISDDSIEKFLLAYSFESQKDIRMLLERHNQTPTTRIAQKALALEVTTIVHGKEAAQAAKRASEVVFDGGDFSALTKAELTKLALEIPSVKGSVGASVVDLLVEGKTAPSKGEARRLIEGKGVSINGTTIATERKLEASDLSKGAVLIRKGKRDVLLVIVN